MNRRVGHRVRRSVDVLGVLMSVARVHVLLRRRPLVEVCARLAVHLDISCGHGVAPAAQPLPRWVQGEVRLLDRAMSVVPGGVERGCLRKSIVLARRLDELGPVVVLGVSPDGEGRRLHAWVEVAGHSLDPSSASFVRLAAAPSP